MKIILMGQAPSPTSDPAVPLSGKSGVFLAKLAAISFEKLGDLFERRNVLGSYPGGAEGKGDLFPMKAAREAVAAMLPSLAGRRVVLLGLGVALAFGFDRTAPRLKWVERDGITFALCPHPSGVNLFWNDVANRAEACRFFGAVAKGDAP